MHKILIFGLSISILAISACQTGSSPNTQASATESGSLERQGDHRQSFVNEPDYIERLKRLLELENQALQLAVDEPLKLGSIGSAILDIYPHSQTGHYALSRFYAYVESTQAQQYHKTVLAQLQNEMRANGDGSAGAPFPVLTINDARTYAINRSTKPVGALYQTTAVDNFRLLLVVQPEQAQLDQLHFDLAPMLEGFAQASSALAEHPSGSGPSQAQMKSPWALMRWLAAGRDTAAQAAIGRFLSLEQNYDDAISWLRVAARVENVLANSLLASIYLVKAEASDVASEREENLQLALENHLQAIAMGSTDAMYILANLYLNDVYGEDNRVASIPLLEQAGELGNADALMYLGYLYSAGREVPQNTETSANYFRKAASLNNTEAKIIYGRFISSGAQTPSTSKQDQEQARQWLEDLTSSAEAMVVLGNLHAKGIGTRMSTSRAVRSYKKAVNIDPKDADIVNEVAWTLTVSTIPRLQRTRYAKQIMDKLMTASEQAMARPEYLDTWAATHAATGDFAGAKNLQLKAIQIATDNNRDDVIDILKKHLGLFEARTTVTEQTP